MSRPSASKAYSSNAFAQSPPWANSGSGSSAVEKYGTSASYSDRRRAVSDSAGPVLTGVRSRPFHAAAPITVTRVRIGP